MSRIPFIYLRWRGQVPPAVLLWRDMVCVGTVINVLASSLALAALALGAPTGFAVVLHLAPLPYNVFLLTAFLRLQDRHVVHTIIAAVWFLLVLVI